MKIGIPRALIYWKRPYFWEEFFKILGFEVLISPKTNKEIVEMGTKVSDPETCFSNKVYFGHLKWLEGKCDLIFIPRLKTNEEGLEYCPKFFGLPDLAKIVLKTPILTEKFDQKKEEFAKSLKRLGSNLKKKKSEVIKAQSEVFLLEERKKDEKEREFFNKIKIERRKIVLISHPYNLYDEYVNLGIKEKLNKLGVETFFIDEIPDEKENFYPKENIKFHWEFGKEMMEKIGFILKYKINGAIQISSFACGCDAVLKEFVEKIFKEREIPFLYLIIDEQTGEAGFQTRIEAFIDTLKYNI